MMNEDEEIYINYEKQQQAFHNLLKLNCKNRILLFKGQSGFGKTALVKKCLQENQGVQRISYDFREASVNSLAEVFQRVVDLVGWKKMKTLYKQFHDVQILNTEIDKNAQIGWGNKIYNIQPNIQYSESQFEKEDKLTLLTSALFADLDHCSEPFLMVFDGYEKASSKVSEWLAGPFLSRVPCHPCLRVLITGQRIPDSNTVEWGFCCESYELLGIKDANHWLPVIRQLGRYIPQSKNDNSLSWLAGVCYALDGNPSAIMQVINRLPRLEENELC